MKPGSIVYLVLPPGPKGSFSHRVHNKPGLIVGIDQIDKRFITNQRKSFIVLFPGEKPIAFWDSVLKEYRGEKS